MFRVIYLVLTVFAAICVAEGFGSLPHPDGRIIGGSDASIYDFPHQVSLRYNNEHWCGGSIYSENIIITAGHCVHNYPPEVFTVVAGSSFLSESYIQIPVHKIITHPSFRTSTSDYDVSVLVLRGFLIFRPGVQSIALAKDRQPEGTIATLTGWGYYDRASGYSNQLQKVNMGVMSQADCRKSFPILVISSEMICTAVEVGKNACNGDVGSPLIVNNQLLGIHSWTDAMYCGDVSKPTVHASVPDLYEWIVNTAEENTISFA